MFPSDDATVLDDLRPACPPSASPADTALIWRLLGSLTEGGGFAGYVGWTISDRPAGRLDPASVITNPRRP